MAQPTPGTSSPVAGSLGLPTACSNCRGPLARGFIGTNGRVFWSEERHFLGVTGDEPLIPVALLRTNYLPATICRSCALVSFFYGGDGEMADADAIVNDAESGA